MKRILFEIQEGARHLPERVGMWIAWHMPRRLVYLAAIRVAAAATTGPYADRTPDRVSVLEALTAWDVESRA